MSLKDATKKRRRYASFFDWPDKQIKERGIVEELISSLAREGHELRNLRTYHPDPPDCVCDTPAGGLVALEVVELVSQEAVELNARGTNFYRWWEPEDIRAGVRTLLSRKDQKAFNGGPYVDIAVVIHTDEPTLTADDARAALEGISYGPFDQVTRAFLIFSYMPGKGYEVIELPLLPKRSAP